MAEERAKGSSYLLQKSSLNSQFRRFVEASRSKEDNEGNTLSFGSDVYTILDTVRRGFDYASSGGELAGEESKDTFVISPTPISRASVKKHTGDTKERRFVDKTANEVFERQEKLLDEALNLPTLKYLQTAAGGPPDVEDDDAPLYDRNMTDYTRASRSVKQVLQAVRAPFAVEHGQQGPGKTVGKVAPEEKLIAILQKLWSETAAQTENGKSDERSVAAYLKRCRWIHGKYQSGGRTADGLLWSSLSESEKVADEMLYTQKERQKFSRKRDRPQEEE